MKITLTAMNKGGEHILDHDLNFAAEQYENTQKVVCSPYNFTYPQIRKALESCKTRTDINTFVRTDLQESKTRTSRPTS